VAATFGPCTAVEFTRYARGAIGTNAGGVHTVVTQTLSTGRTHVNAASGFVADNPDDDIVGEAEPTALVARLDAARIDIGGQLGHDRRGDAEGCLPRDEGVQRSPRRLKIGEIWGCF
jgi:hypothetical protein